MDLLRAFYIFMTALFASLLMVPGLRRWALETGIMDQPDSRKVHRTATPRIGGVAVFMAFLFSTLVYIEMGREVRGLVAGALIVFFTGLVDDLWGLKARWKLLGQVGGCLVTVFVGGLHIERLGDLFGFGTINLPLWAAVPFTVFAVVGVSNALNLIDGLDGLAGGVATIALGAFSLLAFHDGNAAGGALCAALLGGVLGFLRYNAFPARIFLGDTGSLTIGFLLAFLAIRLTQGAATIHAVVPFVILGVPIIDAIWVMCRRVLQRISPFTPDRSHVHHRFLALGFQHRFAVLVIYGVSLFWAAFTVVFHEARECLLLSSFLVTSALFYVALSYVGHHRERFPLVEQHASGGLRSSALYLRVANCCDCAMPALEGGIVMYLFAVAYVCFVSRAEGAVLMMLSLIFVWGGMVMLCVLRSAGTRLCNPLVYGAALLFVFQAEQHGNRALIEGVSLDLFSTWLFAAVAVLISLKAIFRCPGERSATSPLDYILLLMCLSVVILSPELNLAYNISGVVSKGILLILALKTVIGRTRESGRFVWGVAQGVLLFVFVQGVL